MAHSVQQNTKPSKPRKRKSKRNRVRTKTCAKCFTPCTTITRCRLGKEKGSTYICDICWPTYCEPDPDYRYEGTWQSGRIIDREKPQDAEENKVSSPSATEARSTDKNPSKSKSGFQKRGRGLMHRLVRREGGGKNR